MPYSSEALKQGIKPNKDPRDMTEAERREFAASLIDPDSMGFDGHEGMIMEGELCP